MGIMHCPSDFRFGDESNPQSPYYDGNDEAPEEELIVIPFDMLDEDGNPDVRLNVLVAYTKTYEADEEGSPIWDYDTFRAVEYRNGNQVLTPEEVEQQFSYTPHPDEFRDVILGMTASKQAALLIDGKHPDGHPISLRATVYYDEFPPAPGKESVTANEIQNVQLSLRFINLAGPWTPDGWVKAEDFARANPDADVTSRDFLRSVLLQQLNLSDDAKAKATSTAKLGLRKP